MVRYMLFRLRQYPAIHTNYMLHQACTVILHDIIIIFDTVVRQKRNLKYEKYLFQQCCHLAALHWHASRCMADAWSAIGCGQRSRCHELSLQRIELAIIRQ